MITNEDRAKIREVWKTLTPEQKNIIHRLVGEAINARPDNPWAIFERNEMKPIQDVSGRVVGRLIFDVKDADRVLLNGGSFLISGAKLQNHIMGYTLTQIAAEPKDSDAS